MFSMDKKTKNVWLVPVRRRIMMIYATITGLLFLLCFSVAYAVVSHAVYRHLDKELERNRDVFLHDYLHPSGDLLQFVQNEFDEETAEIGVNNLFVTLTSPDGKCLVESPQAPELAAAMRAEAFQRKGDFHYQIPGRRPGRARSCVQELPDGNLLIVGVERSVIDRRIRDLRILFFCSFLLVLVLSIAAGFLFTPYVTRAAEIAFKSLSDTTDAIAHDLRTPLTRLRARSELAVMTRNRKGLAEDVAEECDAMLEMINTMLEIAAASNRASPSPRQNLDLRAIIRSAVELYESTTEDKGIQLTLRIGEGEKPIWYSGHKSKVQQMIGNLLDNAVKFTPRGGKIEVGITDGGDSVTFFVRDTGCGIAPKDKRFVFERFYRGDKARTQPGNGLGLALVKAVVTSYGGKISLSSSPSGTMVTIWLPRRVE